MAGAKSRPMRAWQRRGFHELPQNPPDGDVNQMPRQPRASHGSRHRTFTTKAVLFLSRIVMFLVVLTSAVYSKLCFMTLLHFVNNLDSATEAQAKHRPPAFAALVLAIVCPYAIGFLNKAYRTPLRDTKNHEWPSWSQLGGLAVASLLEAVGVTLFCLAVCPNLPMLFSLGLICLVHWFPISFNTFIKAVKFNLHSLWPKLPAKWVVFGYLIQAVCVVSFVVMTLKLDDAHIQRRHLVLGCGLPFLFSLAAVWKWLSFPPPPTQNSSQRGDKDVFKPSQTLRASMISLLLRLIISIITIAIISAAYAEDCRDGGSGPCNVFRDMGLIGQHEHRDVLYALLGLLLGSFVAYHASHYAIMMGRQFSGFVIPFLL